MGLEYPGIGHAWKIKALARHAPTTGNTNSLVSFDWVAPIFLTWSSPLHWITPDLKTFLSHVTGLLLFSRLSDALISIERLAAASEVLKPFTCFSSLFLAVCTHLLSFLCPFAWFARVSLFSFGRLLLALAKFVSL